MQKNKTVQHTPKTSLTQKRTMRRIRRNRKYSIPQSGFHFIP